MKKHLPSTDVVRPLPEQLPVLAGDQAAASVVGIEVQLREYLRVLVKFRWLILGTTLGCGVAALLWAFTVTPRYTAASRIRISTYEPVLSATDIESVLQQKSAQTNYFETQIEEIRSFSLADRVLDDPQIRKGLFGEPRGGIWQRLFGAETTPSVEEPAGQGDRVDGYKYSIPEIQTYLESIEVRPIRRTLLVVIEATAHSGLLAAQIANKHATAYIDWVRDTRIDQQSRGLEFLNSQASELRTKVADLEREMADYAEAHSIVAVNKDENITAQKMSQLNKLLTDATAKRIEAEDLFRQAEKVVAGSGGAGFDDTSMQSMRSELGRLEAEHAQLSAKFTANYPKLQQLASQIAGLKRSIESQRQQVVAGLKAKFLAAQGEEKSLLEELEQQKSKTFELSKRQVHYNSLNRELTTSRELLESVLKQIKETSLTVESNASNVTVVDLAVVPSSPSSPVKRVWLLIGLLVGFSAGVAASFLLSYLDDTIRTPEEALRTLALPNLGVVPSFALEEGLRGHGQSSGAEGRGARQEGESAEDEGVDPHLPAEQGGAPVVFVHNPKSLASEAYRTIRTGILLSQAGQPPRTLLVSSAQSSEGKTTSSVNLAASLASAGGQVVLIDADLRRPSVHKYFGMPRDLPGLVEVITGQRNVADVAVKNLMKRITVIPAGKIPPNPAELLGSLEMASILDELAHQFDYVVIDSPPILPVTDSVILSRYVDGVVLVVRGASTPRKVVRDAKQRLQSVGARILGTILNDVDVTSGDYHYYSRYYYSYYSEDSGSGAPARTRRRRHRSEDSSDGDEQAVGE